MFYTSLVCLHLMWLILGVTPSLAAKTNWHKPPTITLQPSHHKIPAPQILPDRAPNQPQENIKDWNVIIYVAGNNNLYSFVDANLKQLMTIGSSEYLNIIVQVDKFGTHDVTRSLVQKGKCETYWKASDYLFSERVAHPEIYNSGALTNFIDFVQTAIQRFPAKKNCIIVWDHGAGSYDPNRWRQFIADENISPLHRGMAFNDNYNFFLSNQDITAGLTTISQNALGGKPIDILGLDICHGGQLEIASQVKEVVSYIVASQEVELASGWNYIRALARIHKETRTPVEFALDIINGYREEYINITPDYTLALYDLATGDGDSSLTFFEQLEHSLDFISRRLIMLLESSEGKLVRKIISDTRNKRNLCCDFYSGEYIDLHLFLLSLQSGLRQLLNLYDFRYKYPESTQHIQDVIIALTRSIELVYKVVPSYTAGAAFSGNPIRSRGISIAFPERVIHNSYTKTIFAQNNTWFEFLKKYLSNK